MKIRPLTLENHPKALALLRQAFPSSRYEDRLFTHLHKNKRTIFEWVCVHTNRYVAYIAFTQAYHDNKVYGLHLAPLAVNPQFQNQGIGSELLRFALRQKEIREQPLFVLGDTRFYNKFGFEQCTQPLCPFTKNNTHFLSIRNPADLNFTVGYEPEFTKYK